MKSSLTRTLGAALSLASVAVVGVGGMSPAQAAQAGVSTQRLQPVSTSSAASSTSGSPAAASVAAAGSPVLVRRAVDPAALPVEPVRAIRSAVDEQGRLTRG